MLEPYKLAGLVIPSRKTWHARTHEEISTAHIGSWRQRLEPWEIMLCESAMG